METSNKIIAEFMGAKLTKDLKIMYPVYEGDSSYVKNLKYHSDWNWLMEVVEKITILEEFQEWEFNSLFWEVFCQLDITEIYNQVVLFIEYYNENSADKN